MKKKLTHNLGLKLLSLALAFVLWFLVIQIENPKDTTTFTNIPVKLINTELLDEQNKVYEVINNTDTLRRVTVKAARSITDQLRAEDIVAEADVSRITDINTVAINFYVQNAAVDSIEGSHDLVRLNVEEKLSRWVGLTYNTVGEVAENYIIAGVTPDQNRILVTGPESVVEKISYAKTEIGVAGATTDQSASVAVELYDAQNNLVEHPMLVKNVNYVHMKVEVLATKEVPVEFDVMGVPAEGYMATGVVESTVSRIRIAGRASALNAVNKISIPAEKLNITGADEDMTVAINLKEYLPDGIRLAESGSSSISVKVYIEPIVEKRLEVPTTSIEITNLPQGYTANIPDDDVYYALEVMGLAEWIDPLRPAALGGIVDIAAWMTEQEIDELQSGIYEIPVSFNLSKDITVVTPVTARVVILKQEGEL